jgi:hypothetical protein
VEKTGTNRPWKSQERFPLSHSFNNNKLDDRDHFQQNAKTSVASLRGLIGSSRNIDRHHSGMLIGFIGIPIWVSGVISWINERPPRLALSAGASDIRPSLPVIT